MRFARVACSLVVLLSSAVLAAEGDALVVLGEGVNVRARPESGAPILLQVYRADRVVEAAREGDWVQVRLPERDTIGWIHGSLLAADPGARPLAAAAPAAPATAQPAPAVASPEPPPPVTAAARAAPAEPRQPPAAAAGAGEVAPPGAQQAAVDSTGATAAVGRFRDSVVYLNNRAVSAAGVDLFTGVEPAGNGVVRVIATDAWSTVPEAGKESFMNTLFDRWLAAAGAAQPLRVEIVDDAGRVLRERSGP